MGSIDGALTKVRSECGDLRVTEAQLRRELRGTPIRDRSMLAELSVLRAQNMALRKCIDNKCVPGCSTSSSASLGDFKRDLGRDEGSSRDTLLKAWAVDKKATIIART